MKHEELEAIAEGINFNWTTRSAMQDLRKAWVMGAIWYQRMLYNTYYEAHKDQIKERKKIRLEFRLNTMSPEELENYKEHRRQIHRKSYAKNPKNYKTDEYRAWHRELYKRRKEKNK